MRHDTQFIALTQPLRQRIEATIEHLVALLDEIDGDTDLECTGDDEPTHGWPAAFGPSQLATPMCDDDEREMEDEHGGDILDEPHDDDELEHCDGYYDAPGLIEGGQGL